VSDGQPYPRRRTSDFDPDDHDLLIELRTEIRGIVQRIDGKMGDFATGLSAHRAETSAALTRFDERMVQLENDRRERIGAERSNARFMALAIAASNVLVVAAVKVAERLWT
jgi:hypothetical protein